MSWVQRKFIEKPLVASKSFSRGLQAEELVKKNLQSMGWFFRKSRYKICYQEVDLVFVDSQGAFLLVEVKAISDPNFLCFNLRPQQFAGYKRALENLRERKLKVDFWIAIVLNNNIQWIKEVF